MDYNLKSIIRFFVIILLIYPKPSFSKSNIELVGDYIQVALPLYALFLNIKNKDTEGFYQFRKSFTSTIATTHILKRTVKKKRPFGHDINSFPSGHTASAFSGAFFLHTRYLDTRESIVAYSLASFVGYSRVHAKKHYPIDVLAGALLAYGFNYLFTDSKYNIETTISKDKQAIYLNWVF